jgi:hypothetical protein
MMQNGSDGLLGVCKDLVDVLMGELSTAAQV